MYSSAVDLNNFYGTPRTYIFLLFGESAEQTLIAADHFMPLDFKFQFSKNSENNLKKKMFSPYSVTQTHTYTYSFIQVHKHTHTKTP